MTFPGAIAGTRQTADVVITTNVLDPYVYKPLGAAVCAAYSLKPDEASLSARAADALTAFSVETFRNENRRISDFLTGHATSVPANEDAAVLLGAFAMRENSGLFWNPLPACARATAHLVLAEGLNGASSKDADALLARLFIGLMVDTKAVCQEQIAELGRLASSRPSMRSWVAATAFRNTRDWRPGAGATLVERVEKFRALCDAAGTGAGVKFLAGTKPEDVTDWARIAMEVSWSVEDGHRFATGMLEQEIKEALAVMGRAAPKSEREWSSFIEALNAPSMPMVATNPEGVRRVEVIDGAMWAQNAQRHISHAIYESWVFLADQWGVPDDARTFWSGVEGAFQKMELFPLVVLFRAESPRDVQSSADRLNKLFADRPELVPDMAWGRRGAARYAGLFPDIQEQAAAWFTPPILTGTAYRFGMRSGYLPNFHPSVAEIEAIHRIAPLQQNVVVSYMRMKMTGTASESELRDAAGPLLDYCLSVIRAGANQCAKDPALREKLLVADAQISPDDADQLAKFYLARKQPDKAAIAYQAYVDGASDRVRVANTCSWLVNYYFDNGKRDKALEIAKMAAEVYSYAGLETCAALMERMGDLNGAEENYQHIAERYEDGTPLYLFYKRHEIPNVVLAGKAKEIESRVFLDGIKQAALKDFSDRPKAGVSIDGDSPALRNNGLHSGDVIVAIDGRRVDTFEQYCFIRSLTDVPKLRLIVYQNGSYREIAAEAEGRRFGVDMSTVK